VYDFSPESQGICVGIPLGQALSYGRTAVVIEADVTFYEGVFKRVLASLEQRSPVVEPGEMGCAYVGLDGLEEMYGGEAHLVNALVNAVPDYLAPQVGVGGGKFPTYVAARCAEPGRALRVPEDVGAFLAGHPVEVLPLRWAVLSRLRSFGLKVLGQVASLPVGALQAQFGPEGRLMWELANGIDRSPLIPRRTEQTVSEWLSFPTPTASMGVVNLAVDTLLGRAFAQPTLTGRYARLATLEGQVHFGPHWFQRVPFREPIGDKSRSLFAIKSKLESHPVPGPLDDLRLTLLGITGELGRQTGLFPEFRRWEQLREALKHLEVSLGKRPPIYQVREVEPWSRLAERRRALVEYVP